LALLAVLAAHPVGEVSRDQIVALLWPDRDGRRGRHLLSEALYRLRGAVGRDAIRSVGNGLVLNPDRLWTDVHAFGEALEAGDHRTAVELYRGPFLEGFHLSDDGEFQPWADGRRIQLAARYAEAVDALIAEATASGSELEAAHWLRLRLARDPFSGSSVRKLMASLARAGDRAEAIRVGREYETRLRDEMGLPPPEEVTRLRARLESPHWISPRPAPARWNPQTSGDRRAVPRVRPSYDDSELERSAPRGGVGVQAPPEGGPVRNSLGVLGSRALLVLILATVASVVALRYSSGSAADLSDGTDTYPVAVLPFSSCCTATLGSETERFALILGDTLTGIPGHRRLDPALVLNAWREASTPPGQEPRDLERFAAGLGATRFVTGSVIEVAESEVRVALALREVGRATALYERQSSGSRREARAVLENLAGGLAEFLRGEAAGRGLTPPADSPTCPAPR